AVADGCLEADGILDEIEQLPHSLLGKAALLRELFLGRLAVELLRELTARAHEPSNLVRDVARKSDRPALVGQRASYCLATPPGSECMSGSGRMARVSALPRARLSDPSTLARVSSPGRCT